MLLKFLKIICLVSVIIFPKKAVLLSLGSENIQKSSVLRSPELYTQIRSLNKRPKLKLTEEDMSKFKIWPQGTIPYFIDDFSFDKVLRDKIRVHLDEINSQTGLQFMELPRPPDDNSSRWVMFINRRGALNCVDHNLENFTNEGVQKIVLGYDCLENGGALAAAVLALVGIPPQHNSPDRDNYIAIQEKNILPEKTYLFKAVTDTDWLFKGLDYDFSSAGHYDFHKYTSNGATTIEPKEEISISVGEAQGLSPGDILKITMIYNPQTKKKANKSQHCSKMFVMESDTNQRMTLSEEIECNERTQEKPGINLGSSNTKDVTNGEDFRSRGINKIKFITPHKLYREAKSSKSKTKCKGKTIKNQTGEVNGLVLGSGFNFRLVKGMSKGKGRGKGKHHDVADLSDYQTDE